MEQSKPFPWMCPKCREKTVSPVQIDYTVTAEHDGKGYEVTLDGAAIPTCSRCGQAIVTSDLLEAISAELRRVAGLLSPEAFRANREALALTQADLAAALRIAEPTFARWESGAQLQPRALDLLLRLYFEHAEVRRACA